MERFTPDEFEAAEARVDARNAALEEAITLGLLEAGRVLTPEEEAGIRHFVGLVSCSDGGVAPLELTRYLAADPLLSKMLAVRELEVVVRDWIPIGDGPAGRAGYVSHPVSPLTEHLARLASSCEQPSN